MHVVVIGAGVVGVTTAHYLAQAGHEVTVLERAGNVAGGTSCANGAQLSYSFVEVLPRPEMLWRMPGLLLGTDAAIRIRPPMNAAFIRWGIRFLGQCTPGRAESNTVALLQQALHSATLFRSLRKTVPGDYSYRPAGKLVVLTGKTAVAAAEASSALKAEHGCETRVLTMRQALEIEPALASMRHEYAGAVFSQGDEVADARAFTEALAARLLADTSVRIRFDTRVEGIDVDRGSLRALRTGDGAIDADAAVVCAGIWSGELLRPLGIDARLYPVRGYSVTLPPASATPQVSVTDAERRFVISTLSHGVRIAGFADLVGFDDRRDGERIQALLDMARQAAPDAADFDAGSINAWAANRPMTPDNLPRIGPTKIDGLYLNVGHGMLGWTLACSSGQKIAEIVSGHADRPSRLESPVRTGSYGAAPGSATRMRNRSRSRIASKACSLSISFLE